MRVAAPALLPVLRSRLQGEILALLFTDPSVEWTADELATRTGAAYQTVNNELRRLEATQLLVVRAVGRTKLVRANDSSPYFKPLAQLVMMSFGASLIVQEEFGDLGGVAQIFIFGSWAARYVGESGPAPHDVDVLLVGSPDRDAAFEAASRAERRLGREVNVTFRSPQAWRAGTDRFTQQLRSAPLLEIPLSPDEGL